MCPLHPLHLNLCSFSKEKLPPDMITFITIITQFLAVGFHKCVIA